MWVLLLSLCELRFLWSDWGLVWCWRLLSSRGVPGKALSGCLGPEEDWGALLCVLVLDTPDGRGVLFTLVARCTGSCLLVAVCVDVAVPVGGWRKTTIKITEHNYPKLHTLSDKNIITCHFHPTVTVNMPSSTVCPFCGNMLYHVQSSPPTPGTGCIKLKKKDLWINLAKPKMSICLLFVIFAKLWVYMVLFYKNKCSFTDYVVAKLQLWLRTTIIHNCEALYTISIMNSSYKCLNCCQQWYLRNVSND